MCYSFTTALDAIRINLQIYVVTGESGKYVDLEKAYYYDTVRRDKLWQGLEEYGTEGKLLGADKSFYEKSEVCVRIGAKLSGCFPITRGASKARMCDVTMAI